MKKNNTKFVLSVLFLFILGLTACSSSQDKIEGKYISNFDNSIYYIFYKDNTYETNFEWDAPVDSSKGLYSITDGNITLYNEDENYDFNIGYAYNNYIGSWWNGALSKTYDNVTLNNELGDLTLSYNLKEDKTYEYIVTSNEEVVHTENGTYSIDNNEVMCTNSEGDICTFMDIDGNTFCIEYIKE